MKKCIVTFAIGEKYESLLKETKPLMEEYAARIGADLVIYENDRTYAIPHYKKLDAISYALEKYDRVLWVDADVIISRLAPSIFDSVPTGTLGLFDEGRWVDRTKAREEWAALTGTTLPQVYFNTGVIVADKEHAPLFTQPQVPIYHFGEQSFLNHRVLTSGTSVSSLMHHWNRMGCTHAQLGEEPFLSWFIHLAGMAATHDLAAVARETIQHWEVANWQGFKTIVVNCSNGMGNQIASTPAVKFLIKNYPDYRFIIRSAFPEVFEALISERVVVRKDSEPLPEPFVLHRHTANAAIGLQDSLIHPTEYHSLCLLGRQLPIDEARVVVPVSRVNAEFDERTVTIHAGKSGWLSKEMPQPLWQKIVDVLKANGFKIALIGVESMTIKPDWGCFKLKNVDWDFVGASYSETCDVIRRTWMTLSNDSMPIHAAGAFDNFIGLITIAKRPEHILPYRYGGTGYKTLSWCGTPYWKSVPEPLFHDPSRDFNITTLYPGMQWPDPVEVVADIVATRRAKYDR